jgi:integrase
MPPKKARAPGVAELRPGLWIVDVSRRHPMTGAQVRRRRNVEVKTQAEAVAARAALAVELEDELRGVLPVVLAVDSLTDYAVRWLEAKAKRLRATTIEEYRRAAEWLCRSQGETPAALVTRSTVEAFVSSLESSRMTDGRPYAAETLAGIYRKSRTLLRDLAADFDIADPTNRVRGPASQAKGRRERRTLTACQLREMLAVVDRDAPRWSVELHILAFTGMRLGEMRGLRWCDLDLVEGLARIEVSVAKSVQTRTKTGDPRTVGLADETIARLEAHRLAMGASGFATMGPALVFPSRTTRRVVSKRAVQNALINASARAGIAQRVTPQVLRRTFNTLAQRLVDRTVLRDVMGHTTEAMTQRYSDAPDSERRALAGAMLTVVQGGE